MILPFIQTVLAQWYFFSLYCTLYIAWEAIPPKHPILLLPL